MKIPQNDFSPNMRNKTTITELHRLPLVLIAVVSLLVAGWEKKKAVAAEVTPPAKPQAAELATPAAAPAAAPSVVVPVAEPPAEERRAAAIFSVNHANKSFDEKLAALEDFVTGPLTEKGYSVISREIATDAVSGFLKQNSGTTLDDSLSKGSSAARLAQMLNADYLVLVSISSFGTRGNKTVIGGSEVAQTVYTLRVTYKLTDSQGTIVASAPVSVTDTTMSTTGSESLDSDVINRLLEKSAAEVAAKIPPPPAPRPRPKLVEFAVVCGIAEAGGQPLALPAIRTAEDRTVMIDETRAPVLAVNATVELDGAAIGSAPATFRALPGLHKIKITHEQCEPWERTFNISPGLPLKVILQMTDKAYQRWKDQTAFLQILKNGQLLTEAEADKIKGIGQYFRNQSVKVDIKQDIKVDTKEGMKVYKSIY
jgi:hypothetical protein